MNNDTSTVRTVLTPNERLISQVEHFTNRERDVRVWHLRRQITRELDIAGHAAVRHVWLRQDEPADGDIAIAWVKLIRRVVRPSKPWVGRKNDLIGGLRHHFETITTEQIEARAARIQDMARALWALDEVA